MRCVDCNNSVGVVDPVFQRWPPSYGLGSFVFRAVLDGYLGTGYPGVRDCTLELDESRGRGVSLLLP